MVMEDIAHFQIPIYDFPIDPDHDDEDTIEENNELRALLPFAVIGSETELSVGSGIYEIKARQFCEMPHISMGNGRS
jgi:cell division control protein 11